MFKSTILCAILVFVCAQTVDIDLNSHRRNREDWKDPNDFLSSKRRDTDVDTDKLAMEGRLRSMDSMLKLMIRKFMENLDVDILSARDVHRRAVVTISAENLATIRSYLASNNSHNQLTLREQVHSVLEGLMVVDITEDAIPPTAFSYDVASLYSHPIAIPLCIIVVMWTVVLIQRRMTLRFFLFGTFLFCFITSCVLNFIRKHQEIVSEQIQRMHESSLSESCQPDGFFGDFLSLAKGLVFMKTKTNCQKFHEDMFVTPLAQINPLEIMSEVLASFLAAPLTVFARQFNKFFNEYYADTPLHIFVIKTVMLVLGSAVFFFVVSGYRLRTLFATLEPGTVPVIEQVVNALTESPVDQPKAEIRAIGEQNTTELALRNRSSRHRSLSNPPPSSRLALRNTIEL